ncbi:hypothetical protein AE45_04897, partial [Escherichia coli BIDMC 70]
MRNFPVPYSNELIYSTYADLGAENWKPISNLHDMSSSHSKTLGYKRL